MKIRAEFYTADECDAAAGAVRDKVPGVYDIALRDCISADAARGETDYGTVYAAYNNVGGTPSYSFPLYGAAAARYAPRGRYSAEFVCRESDAKNISHILVNRGGHNIRSI